MVNPFVYQDVFSGSNIYPSDATYAAITLASDVTYSWPLESSPGINNLLPRILDVTCNTYKTSAYANAGNTTPTGAAVGATSIVLNSVGLVVVGNYITIGPLGSPAPLFYKVIALVSSATQSTVTIDSPLQVAWPGNTQAFVFTFAPWTITLPSAQESGLGNTTLFVSKSSLAFFAVSSQGPMPTQVLFVPPSTAWQVYLTDNTTPQGRWSSFQYGAALAAYQASGLAGPGLTFFSNTLATAWPVTSFNSNYTTAPGDRALTYVWTGTSGTVSLLTATALGNNWYMSLRNQGSGVLNITPQASGNLINGVSGISLDPGDSVTVITDGVANFYTLGYGRAVSSTFDYTLIDLTGQTGNFVLTGQNQNRIAYNFVGTLSGNVTIVVPQYIQQYWVANNTTANAFTLAIKTANPADPGIVINNGNRAIYYSTGSLITPADNNGVGLPIQVTQGGTGAITANAALINLGGGGLGINLFRSTTPDGAIAALGGIAALQTALGFSPQGTQLVAATNTTQAITALGGAQAIASAIGSATIGDVLALSIALS